MIRIPIAGSRNLVLLDIWKDGLQKIRQAILESRTQWCASESPAITKPKLDARALPALISIAAVFVGLGVFFATYQPPHFPPYDPRTGEPHRFAAIAFSRNGDFGRSWGASSEAAAFRAMAACARQASAGRCRVQQEVRPHQCEAVAAQPGRFGWRTALAGTRADAIRSALDQCARMGPGRCFVVEQVCADDRN